MTKWTPYLVTFKLISPMHIGWRKIGNLQQTRPYVTGKTIWGALTAYLANQTKVKDYINMGKEVDDQLAFTYLYPTIDEKEVKNFPWDDSDEFSWKFLGSYVSTALQKGQGTEDGSLHEIEFIAPITRCEKPVNVFLVGYIFEIEGCKLPWRDVLNFLQLGGERGYGWGKVEKLLLENKKINETIFGLTFKSDPKSNRPILMIPEESKLLAHTYADNFNAIGTIEPVVGRETDNETGYFGKNCSKAQICWSPGSKVKEKISIQIEKKGLWKKCNGV